MKKIVIYFIAFFIMSHDVLAEGMINSVDINVSIDETGEASITEVWQVPRQDTPYFEKKFYDSEGATISNYTVTGDDTEYTLSTSWPTDNNNVYNYYEENDIKAIRFTNDQTVSSYTLNYTVDGFITQFSDTQGIDWYFFVTDSSTEVNTLNVVINGTYSFNESNTALYGIGPNMSLEFVDGGIHLFANRISSNSTIKLMTTFTDSDYTNFEENQNTFEKAYEQAMNNSSFIDRMLRVVTDEAIKIIIIIIVILIIVFIVVRLSYKFKQKDVFSRLIIRQDLSHNNVEYYQDIPCNHDLYLMSFLAGAFKILKNRTDIIGAKLLSWYYAHYITIEIDRDNPVIVLQDNLRFSKKIDMDLYMMLKDAAINNRLDKVKMRRFVKNNAKRVLAWFEKCFDDIVSIELLNGNLKEIKKMKMSYYIINDNLINEGLKLKGLKKYLLNFNQVPRNTPLDLETYKYLLISSNLLGISKEVGEEILRKNPDNNLAQELITFENTKVIYRNIYFDAINSLKLKK